MLGRSDPHLAAMIAIFTRLTAGEAVASWEQAGLPGGRMQRVLARLARATAAAAACLSACARLVIRRAVISWAVLRFRLSRGAWTAVDAPAAPRDPGDQAVS